MQISRPSEEDTPKMAEVTYPCKRKLRYSTLGVSTVIWATPLLLLYFGKIEVYRIFDLCAFKWVVWLVVATGQLAVEDLGNPSSSLILYMKVVLSFKLLSAYRYLRKVEGISTEEEIVPNR